MYFCASFAINLPNKGYIEHLPKNIVVEVTRIVNNYYVRGVKGKNYPSNFTYLLMNQTNVMQLIVEVILEKSKDKTLKAS